MIDSYKKQVRDQAWALLEASAPILVALRASNRKRTNLEAGQVKAAMASAQPADLPLIRIDAPRTASAGFSGQWPFDIEGDPADLSGNIAWQFTLAVTIYGDVRKPDEQDHIADSVWVTFLAAGPRFGLDFVVMFGPMTTQQSEFTTQQGVKQLRTVLSIPFSAELDYQALRASANQH